MTQDHGRPSPGMFGVLRSYGYPVTEITRVTDQCFWSRGGSYRGNKEVRAYLDKLACWSLDKPAAELASQRLVSAEAEKERRMREARLWFMREVDRIKASAIEAGTAETAQAGSVHESAVPVGETPND